MNDLRAWKKNAQLLITSTPEGYKTHKAYIAMLEYIHKKDWSGACHSTSAIMVSILRSQGVSAEPFLGECRAQSFYFDHSWVEVDANVFDIAISKTLIKGIQFPPVYRGLDLGTMSPSHVNYGVQSGNGYDRNAARIKAVPLVDYMDAFPGHPYGLFGLAEELTKSMGKRISKVKLRKSCLNLVWRDKYGDCH
ncbi:MAG: hypothetical protein RH947_13000 [Alcanivorax sp.]|tara:strand:- start:164 stop:742 length:579 start_codon:yes stop_codon:yes gene_type:complete